MDKRYGQYNSKIKHEQTASLDRINSYKGYIPDNVQWVHKDINIMKNNHSQKEFIEYCKKVVSYTN